MGKVTEMLSFKEIGIHPPGEDAKIDPDGVGKPTLLLGNPLSHSKNLFITSTMTLILFQSSENIRFSGF